MKQPITWSKYKSEIIDLSKEGKFSSEILQKLKKKYGDIFPNQAQRRIQEILHKHNPQAKRTNAKILIFDIETAPITAYTWSKYPEEISDNMIVRDWFVLCWSAKYLFEDKIFSAKLTQEELIVGDDKRIMESLWQLLDNSDIVIGHNAAKFDVKKSNTRFIKHGLPCPSSYQIIDTLLHARKQFAISSNRLDYLAGKFFEVGEKMETEKNLWVKCMQGDVSALNKMQIYCDNDVKILEAVYLEMRGWISPHPNTALQAIGDNDCCPVCSSAEREDCKVPYRTYVNEYNAYRCKNCSHVYRSRVTNTPIKSNKGLKVSIPK